MRLLSLKFLDNYKQFKANQEFIFSQANNIYKLEQNVEMSIFVGRNGSGKTTLMSLIPSFFHNLERYNNNIPANFILIYEIMHENILRKVTLSHNNNLVLVSIDNIYNNIQLLPKRDSRTFAYHLIDINQAYLIYEDIISYLPSTIVTSTFSMHGEYPESRRWNFDGHRIIANKSISNIYGKNHYSIGSISLGIFRFIQELFKPNSKLKNVLELFNLTFTGRIQPYTVEYNFTHPMYRRIENVFHDNWLNIDADWLQLNREIIEHQETYFINDIEFSKNGKLIKLSTMSSGEKMLLIRCFSILNSIKNNSLVIIEEPELHLDQVWNKELSTLLNTLFKDYLCHVLIATHDYSLINSVHNNNLLPIENGEKMTLSENTYLASSDELTKILYGEEYLTNKIEKDFLKSLSEKSTEELKKDLETLGNSVYKYLVFKQLKDSQENVEN